MKSNTFFTSFPSSIGWRQYTHLVELHIWVPLLRQQVADSAENHLNDIQLYGLLLGWFACVINHCHPHLPYRRLAERFFNLMRVINSTSSDYSHAVGGYFVGSMPGWFVVRWIK